MKKVLAFLIIASTLLSVGALGASAVFEPMDVGQMKEALDSSDGDASGKMAFGWGFDDIPTEDKAYDNDVKASIKELLEGGRYSYTVEDKDATAQRGVAGLAEVGTFVRKSSGKSAVVYSFETAEGLIAADAASAFYTQLSEAYGQTPSTPYVHLCGGFVLEGDEVLILSVAKTSVYDTVKHGDFNGNNYNIYGDAYASSITGSVGGIQFKTPDGAIRFEYGELVWGKAHKDYYAEGYKSTDAYADVYTTGADYNKLHDAMAGESFVLSASVRAPYTFDTVAGTMEIFRTRSSFTGLDGKVTLDTILAKYNTSTREIYIYSAGKEIKTGIYLSDLDSTTVAVHVRPKENAFDFYADGILVAKDVTFLTDAMIKQIVPAEKNEPSGALEDYTLTRLRLFYSSNKMLTGDLICVDDFAWYFSDSYLERSEHDKTLIARSAELKDKLYLNFYMNIPRATLNDYQNNACVRLKVGSEYTDIPLMNGKVVESGEYKGLLKYSFGMSFLDIDEELTLSLSAENGHTLYLYGMDGGTDLFAKDSYKTSALEYFKHLLDEENGFGEPTVKLARAVLNYAAYMRKNYFSGANANIPAEELPNFGYAYTAEEIDAVTSELVADSVDSELYKEYVRFGDIHGLRINSNSFMYEDGTYILTKFTYVSVRDLTVNGKAVKPSKDGKYEYVISIADPLGMNDVYTIEFSDGHDYSIIKISPYQMAANMMRAQDTSEASVEYLKAMYLYACAAEEYFYSIR